jgi:hypothetical protein
MKFKTRTILQELNSIAERRDTESLIESRATNIINSACNLMELIHKTYDEDTALDLERRLINSIKGNDAAKFTRGIRKVTESKKVKKDKDVG